MRYYHKCTSEGLLNLLFEYNDKEPLCVSTDESCELFWRNIVLVLETNVTPVAHEQNDLDSRGQTSYDEARLLLSSEDFFKAIKYVIFKKATIGSTPLSGYAFYREPTALESFDQEVFHKNIVRDLLKKRELETIFDIKILNMGEAKKINPKWTSKFLYI